jgi:hypothetical protein
MSDQEKQKLNMYESLITFLSENRDIISGVRSFSWSISKLRKMVDEIKQKDKEISSVTLEKTIIAYKAKDELIIALVPVASALYTFARDSKNLELKEKARNAQSYYIRLRDRELVDKAVAIYSLALSNLSRLRKFGISASVLNDLKIKIDRFKSALGDKVVSFVSSNAVVSLASLFSEADKILCVQMDNYVENLTDVNEEFYDEYLSIRSMEDQDVIDEEVLEMDTDEQ